jgi:hypothetical protein
VSTSPNTVWTGRRIEKGGRKDFERAEKERRKEEGGRRIFKYEGMIGESAYTISDKGGCLDGLLSELNMPRL